MDPNLLPQNLRSKEAKEVEKLKKQPHGFTIELNKPSKTKADFDSDRPKLSLWERIFGVPATKSLPAKTVLTTPIIDKPQNYNMDWLANSGNHELPKNKEKKDYKFKVNVKPKIKKEKGGSWFGKLFGRPVSPILPASALKANPPQLVKQAPVEIKKEPSAFEKNIPASMPKFQPSATPAIEVKKTKNKLSANDGWWSILGDLFGVSKIRERKLNFVASDSILPSKPKVAPERPIKEHAENISHKTKESAKKSAYNLVPKREKTEINVNLIPQELFNKGPAGPFIDFKFLSLAIMGPVVLITAGYFLLVYLQANLGREMTVNKNELTDLNRQIGDFVTKEKQNDLIAKKVLTIKGLVNEKVIWSKFFELLEKYTLDGVYFTSLTADTSGILILPGIADNYGVLAQQLAVFRDATDFVKDVKISNAQLYSEAKAGVLGSSFQIRLVLQDGIFKKAK